MLHYWYQVALKALDDSLDYIGDSRGGLLFGGLIVAIVIARLWKKHGWSDALKKYWRTAGESVVITFAVFALIFTTHLLYEPLHLQQDEEARTKQATNQRDEEHRLRIEEEDRSRPDFHPVINYAPSIGQLQEFPHDAAVTILLRVQNWGAPSITQGWKLRMDLPDGSMHEGFRVIPSFKTMNFSAGAPGSKTQFILHGKDDEIEEKTAETPVERGASKSGYIMFVIKNVDYRAPRQTGTRITVSFRDVRQKEYSMSYVMQGAGTLDEPIYVPGLTVHQ